jgi:DNA polymerase
MSLNLDSRQRAMLQELGVRVWLPEPGAICGSSKAPLAPEIAITNVAADAIDTVPGLKNGSRFQVQSSGPEAVSGLVEGIASMDWPALSQAVASCQACRLCVGRRAPVFGAADAVRRADWLVLGEPPDDAAERAGEPFAEQSARLFDNMLKALGLTRRSADPGAVTMTSVEKVAYVTNVVKCRPALARNPTQQELATCENYLSREVALVQPKVILALGRYAAQALLQGSLPDLAATPLGKLRGQVHAYQGIPVIVSYPPSYLLRSPAHKAGAWADLCLALEVREGIKPV